MVQLELLICFSGLDFPVERLVAWVRLLMDGFLEQIATDPAFTAEREGPMLREIVRSVLTGQAPDPSRPTASTIV